MRKAYPPRAAISHVAVAAAGLIGAISIILFGFFAFTFAPPIAKFVWSVGLQLVALSDKVCTPSAVVCVFGSNSQGRHHLWFFACLFVGWWVILSLVAWFVVKHVATGRAST